MKTAHKSLLRLLRLCVLCLPAFARAGEPTDQIRKTTDKILSIVETPELKGPGKEAERQRLMSQVIDERFDWAAMARSALGKHWRTLSAPQRTEFTGLFSELIEKNYMSRIESYSGEKFLYKGDKVDGPYGVADVVIVTLRGTDIPVTYRVLKKGAAWLVYDIVIEGVSLVNNYRSQIGTILNSSSYDTLIVKIRTKIAAGTPGRAGEKPRAPTGPSTPEESL